MSRGAGRKASEELKRERALKLRKTDPELSLRDIAERVGCHWKSVEKWLIEERKAGRAA